MTPDVRTLDWRYGCLTLAWMSGIWWLSSRSDLGASGSGAVGEIASNLVHLPLFGGLAFCWFRTLSGMPPASWRRHGVAFLARAVWAALDEWHQSFVPGRQASIGDLLVDVAAIVGMLLGLRLSPVQEFLAASSARVVSWKGQPPRILL